MARYCLEERNARFATERGSEEAEVVSGFAAAGVMRELHYGNRWLAIGSIVAGIILAIAVAPDVPAPRMFSDKLQHLAAFGFLMVWFSALFKPRVWWFVALLLLAYGCLIEILQMRLPYRDAEIRDVVFDVAGILLGWMAAASGLGNWAVAVESRLLRNPERSRAAVRRKP